MSCSGALVRTGQRLPGGRSATDDSEIDGQAVGGAAGLAGRSHSDGPWRRFGHGPTLAHRAAARSAAKWTMLAACASP